MSKQLDLYYFKRKGNGNFGDELNVYIPKKLFDIDVIRKTAKEAKAVFIGSVLSPFISEDNFYMNTPVKVWGTGLIQDIPDNTKFIRPLDIYALRGKYTKAKLEKILNRTLGDIPLGDPGLLVSKCFTELDYTKKYDYGIIPHAVDMNNPLLEKFKFKNSIIIDTNEKVPDFINKLVQCKCIVSSAMHGLIAADAYGIPNIRFIASYKLIGGEFKFNDYYSAFNLDKHNIIDLRNSGDITELDFTYNISQKQVEDIQNKLIESFPYA